MTKKLIAVAFALALTSTFVRAQSKPTLIVGNFTVADGVQWPYETKQLQAQTITELKIKDGKHFDVVNDASRNSDGPSYTLEGEVKSWHAGNRATRMFVGLGSGRETAQIHYWLTDQSGKKVFDHTDMIRQAFWGGAYTDSVGQLAQPFADKIASRLKQAKLEETSDN